MQSKNKGDEGTANDKTGRSTENVTVLNAPVKRQMVLLKRKSCLHQIPRKTHEMETGHPGTNEEKARGVILTSRRVLVVKILTKERSNFTINRAGWG